MSKASDILTPPSTDIMRFAFLYVGQGEATLVFIPNGGSHITMLIDANQGRKTGGIDLVRMLKDLLDGDHLDYFVNTHPHLDHAGEVDEISDAITIDNIWHSGHKPGKDQDQAYQAIQRLRKKVQKAGGEDITLLGTRETLSIGNAQYNVLSPAKYVVDEIADEKDEVRYRRIHEHCAVIRFKYGSPESKNVMITGDSDKCAWSEHITEYHGNNGENRLRSHILSASHHGSRTFFKTDEKDEDPYRRHMELIEPEYLMISAPPKGESPFEHPHEDALELYKEYVEEDNILHTGDGKKTIILDISSNGTYQVTDDSGELAEEYGFKGEDDDDGGDDDSSKGRGPFIIAPKIDQRPMGGK
jgi:competence protein ComEC